MLRSLLYVILFFQAILESECRGEKDGDDFGTVYDYLVAFAKVSIACSPIIAIGGILICAREDADTEAAKLESSKKTASCKS